MKQIYSRKKSLQNYSNTSEGAWVKLRVVATPVLWINRILLDCRLLSAFKWYSTLTTQDLPFKWLRNKFFSRQGILQRELQAWETSPNYTSFSLNLEHKSAQEIRHQLHLELYMSILGFSKLDTPKRTYGPKKYNNLAATARILSSSIPWKVTDDKSSNFIAFHQKKTKNKPTRKQHKNHKTKNYFKWKLKGLRQSLSENSHHHDLWTARSSNQRYCLLL